MYEMMRQNGWVEVICGSMFSGKSEELIRRVRRATFGNLSVQVFKPAMDNRYDSTSVVSHDGGSTIACPIEMASDIFQHIENNLDIVGIDEVQFFDENIVAVIEELAYKGIR